MLFLIKEGQRYMIISLCVCFCVYIYVCKRSLRYVGLCHPLSNKENIYIVLVYWAEYIFSGNSSFFSNPEGVMSKKTRGKGSAVQDAKTVGLL